MKVTFKHLGPIQKGSLDLTKRCYLFVGQNNSGKTYTSNLLWCILNEKTTWNFISQSNLSLAFENKQLNLTEAFLTEILAKYAQYIKEIALPAAFNLPNNHFIFEKFEIDFSFSAEKIANMAHKMDLLDLVNNEKTTLTSIITEKGKMSLAYTKEIDNKKMLEGTIWHFLFSMLFEHNHNLVSLPSERKSYSTFSPYFFRLEKEKKSEMQKRLLQITHSRKNGKQSEDIAKIAAEFGSDYTEIMDDLLTKYYKLSEDRPTENREYEACMQGLIGIMQGNIVLESENITPKLCYRMAESTEKLDMYLASSSVNQLSALLHFFRYWAKNENNFLMIDEPEENLSPLNQIKLIDVLYKYVVKNDNRLLLTTHSPIVAKSVNNYLHLGSLKEKGLLSKVISQEKLTIEAETALDAKDFGVYFFDGKQIIDYVEKEGNEYGVFFREFEKATNQVNNFADTLKNYIYESLEEHVYS